MTEFAGTKKLGQTPTVVLGPLDQDVLLQNQGPTPMSIWLTGAMDDTIELLPYRVVIAPVGAEGLLAAAPFAKSPYTYRLFYSSLAVPGGVMYATLPRG